MDEVILKVSPEELSEFPCPFYIETDCDSNCDSSENTKTITEGKIEEESKVGLATKVGKAKRRRGKKGGRKRSSTTTTLRQVHQLLKTPLVIAHSITKPILLDLASCQCDSPDKAHSLHLVTPEGGTNQVDKGTAEVSHYNVKASSFHAEALHLHAQVLCLCPTSHNCTEASKQLTEASCVDLKHWV